MMLLLHKMSTVVLSKSKIQSKSNSQHCKTVEAYEFGCAQ